MQFTSYKRASKGGTRLERIQRHYWAIKRIRLCSSRLSVVQDALIVVHSQKIIFIGQHNQYPPGHATLPKYDRQYMLFCRKLAFPA